MVWRGGPRPAAGVSRQAGAHRGAVRRRRSRRRAGPRGRRRHRQGHRPERAGREQGRRRRHHRCRHGGQGRARRLHHRAGAGWEYRGESHADAEPALQAVRPGAGGNAGHRRKRAGGQRGHAGQIAGGTAQAGRAEAGRAELRLARRRQPGTPRRRTAAARCQRQAEPRTVQGREPGHDRCGRWPGDDDVRAVVGGAALYQGRQAARVGRGQRQTLDSAARCADDRRAGLPEVRGGVVVCIDGAGGYAA
ncbi:hypothetical protein D3C81_965080 [compost metagenome]